MNKNFFIMIADSPWAGPTVEIVDVPSVNALDGEFIDGIDTPFVVNLVIDSRALPTDDFPPRDIHEASNFQLFSSKFIKLLDELGINNIEFLPANVTDVKTNTKLDYSVGNIIGRIKALDENESEFILSSSGKIMGVERMVFDENKIKDHKIFLLGEVPLLIVVHRSVKEAVEEKGLTGFVFFSEEEYEPGII